MSLRMCIAVGVIAASACQAEAATRRALLIGINDYSGSRLPAVAPDGARDRDVPNLDGAVNDVTIMRELLIALYGFKPADIAVMTDQQATRGAILAGLEHL